MFEQYEKQDYKYIYTQDITPNNEKIINNSLTFNDNYIIIVVIALIRGNINGKDGVFILFQQNRVWIEKSIDDCLKSIRRSSERYVEDKMMHMSKECEGINKYLE